MLERLPLGDAVGGEEQFVRHLGGIGLEGEYLGNVALEEDFELVDVDESGRVGDDLRKEALVLLVALQLGLPVSLARDDDGLEPCAVAKDVHVRCEPELPGRVLHLPGNDDLEPEVHASSTLGHVPEAGRDDRGVQDVGRDHLSRFVIPDGLHDEDLPAAFVPDGEGVPSRLPEIHFG